MTRILSKVESKAQKTIIFPELHEKTSTKVQDDLVSNPAHYQGRKCLDGLKDFLEPKEYIGGLKFNVYKYLFRYKAKNGIQDLKKAEYYLKELIDFEAKEKQL